LGALRGLQLAHHTQAHIAATHNQQTLAAKSCGQRA
jgi:hypothetical protein